MVAAELQLPKRGPASPRLRNGPAQVIQASGDAPAAGSAHAGHRVTVASASAVVAPAPVAATPPGNEAEKATAGASA